MASKKDELGLSEHSAWDERLVREVAAICDDKTYAKHTLL